ncbi:hypothetical protein H9X78_14950, partial [Clostridium saudiense]|nr:hypothetical protein [Clostridium saudiense]
MLKKKIEKIIATFLLGSMVLTVGGQGVTASATTLENVEIVTIDTESASEEVETVTEEVEVIAEDSQDTTEEGNVLENVDIVTT